MKVSSIKITTINSNGEIVFPPKELTLYNFKIMAVNPQMNLTITFYDRHGLEQTATSTPLKNAITLYGQYATFSKITFSDTYQYNIIVVYQVVKADNEQEYEQLKEQMNLDLVPIDNIIIVSPLDTNGYVLVDDPLLNSKMASANGTIQNGSISVSTTATALNSDTNLVEALTLYAPSSNTATVNVGNSSSQSFPLLAGSSLTLRKVKPSNVYLVSTNGTQTVYYVYGE
jgi:hypothetical protein